MAIDGEEIQIGHLHAVRVDGIKTFTRVSTLLLR